MIRDDGDVKIYRLQVGTKDGWTYPNLDYFGYPNGFNADGKCWQQTGIHGTFNKNQANAAYRSFIRKYPHCKWRLVCVNIIESTVQVHHKKKMSV